ncbi:MAG: alanine racemase, partial [Calditrichia bacterium]|nr:alanine racemase [Calditrichia bacterium]
FRKFGTKKIAVSSMDMAEYFANSGWDDITVAIPVNINEIDKINRLAEKINLNLLVDSIEAFSVLNAKINHKIGIWIKVDIGYRRVGIFWNRFEEILELSRKISNSKNKNISFQGILTHAGHSYNTSSIEEIHFIYEETVSRMLAVKNVLNDNKIKKCLISIGDTPTCSLETEFKGVDEIRPGNFVFYDVMQYKLGVCGKTDIAAAVACPVIGKYPDRRQIVIYGGGVHFSKEYILDNDNRKIFGYLTSVNQQGFAEIKSDCPVVSLSQEHGIIEMPKNEIEKIKIGDIVVIYPVHSCLTANLYNKYLTIDENIIERLGY